MTCGPWKPVYLERYKCRIEEVRADIGLSDSLAKATLAINVTLDAETQDPARSIEIEVLDPNGTSVEIQKIQSNSATFLPCSSRAMVSSHPRKAATVSSESHCLVGVKRDP